MIGIGTPKSQSRIPRSIMSLHAKWSVPCKGREDGNCSQGQLAYDLLLPGGFLG